MTLFGTKLPLGLHNGGNLTTGGGVRGALLAAFRNIIAAGISDASLLILADSTSNANEEWVRLLDSEWAAYAPDYMVRNALYVDSAGAYGSGSLGARLTNNEPGTALFQEDFNRADGAVGTTTMGGQSWTANDWTISSGKATQTASFLTMAAAIGTDKYIAEANVQYGANATENPRCYVEFANSSNAVLVSMAANGVFSIVYLPGSVVLAQVGTGSALSNGENLDFKITVDGTWVQAECRGYTITGILSSAQRAALTGNKVTFYSAASAGSPETKWDNIRISAILPQRRLDVRNAAHPGADTAYHIAEIAATAGTSVIGTANLAIINLGHNEEADDVATFQGNMDSLVTALRGEQAGIPVVIMMENPEIAPAANAAAHNARQESLPAYARSRGYDLINAYSGFDTANLESDGVHPTPTGSIYIKNRAKAAFGI